MNLDSALTCLPYHIYRLSCTDVLNHYLDLSGAKKDELSEFLKTKKGVNAQNLDAAQLERFYASRLSEGDLKDKNKFVRYAKLTQLRDNGSSYPAMLEEYKKMGGGGAYVDFIRDNLKTGMVFKNGGFKVISFSQVEDYEQARIDEVNSERQLLIQTVEAQKDSMSYPDLLRYYEEQSKNMSMHRIRRFIDKHISRFDSDYEAHLKQERDKHIEDKTLYDYFTPEDLMKYTLSEKEERGSIHAKRLKELYNVDSLPDKAVNLDTLTPPPDMETRRQKYLEDANDFKASFIAKTAAAEKKNAVFGNDDLLKAEIVSFEQQKKEASSASLNELERIGQQIRDRESILQKQISISSNVVYNIAQLKDHPEHIFEKIEDFRQAVEEYKKHKDTTAQMTAANNQLIGSAQQAINQANNHNTGG